MLVRPWVVVHPKFSQTDAAAGFLDPCLTAEWPIVICFLCGMKF